ncbi:chemotaxis protein CheA [Moritella sp. Urea-trap-13]|uniref:chemotaxis protein CheA n=1 Tax=Moritella sp. Urea-trap-13 TaxID=2058327 RepID=UPI000C32003F|nr:chemotaxis protein CheA [Moritella sp. Urea-trap-13]PKH07848.1 chemotaxis protein CheA [Moritella sp. Urea-trap-13]
MSSDLDAVKQVFLVEAEELLAAMEDALLHLESNPDDMESINAVFRAAHTIKGTSGVFGFDDVVTFTHVAESLLDKIRDSEIVITKTIIEVLLKSGDHMSVLVNEVIANDGQVCTALLATSSELISQLNGFMQQAPAEMISAVSVNRVEILSSDEQVTANNNWHISLRFGVDVFKQGMDPISFVKYLQQIGRITHLTVLPEKIPALKDIDPEACYLGFEISLTSDCSKEEIESVFEFVQEDCDIRIIPPNSAISRYIKLIQELPEEDQLLGEILVKSDVLTKKELNSALDTQQLHDDAGQATVLGEILINQGVVAQEVVGAAVEKQQHVRAKKNAESHIVRVNSDKLDELINMVGELVIASASASLLANKSNQTELEEASGIVDGLVDSIRNNALSLRMVPIGDSFHRFQRVVRDVSGQLEKSIELVITGAETELDKMVVEKIGDPLMHLVRNSLDHGLEKQEQRIAAGKDPQGKIHLNAYHDSGSIVIEISDDGKGLNKALLLEKAIAKGIVDAEQVLSDDDIHNLIFHPGFSTADSVSNISGRGVGMDVVKRNILALRGSIDLESEEGEGTVVRIRLPLTLAIIDGFQVGVKGDSYVVPLDMVIECVEYTDFNQIPGNYKHDSNYFNLRGEALPLVKLTEHFKYPAVENKQDARANIVVVHYAGRKAGLVVDQLMGEFQTVIKPLGKLFSEIRGIGGSTILGSGEVALILDVQQLVQDAEHHELKQIS